LSLPQHILYQKGGVISIDLPERPSNARVSIRDGHGTELLSEQTATVSTIQTTLNTAASAGDTSINVASTTGILSGSTFWLQDVPEQVLAKSVASATGTVTLWRKLREAHANAATAEGTTVNYSITEATNGVNTLFWDGHAVWNMDGGDFLRHTAVECTKYPLVDLTGDQDLLDEDPKIYDKLDDEHSAARARQRAAEDVFARIGAKDRARVFADSGHSFKRAIVYQWFINFYRGQTGDEAREQMRTYSEFLEGEMDRLGLIPRDTDQDGRVEVDEQWRPRTGRIRRG
jgi:prepilin-type processing-associated H-X9-DG protein